MCYVIVITQDEYDILLLHERESEAKLRMSVNNKDIIWMYLGYNWLITQKTLPINALFVTMVTEKALIGRVFWVISHAVNNGFRLCSPIKASFVTNKLFLWFFSMVISTYCPRTDIYLSVLWLVVSDTSHYKTLWCMASLGNNTVHGKKAVKGLITTGWSMAS